MILHLLRIFFLLVVLAITIPFAFKDPVTQKGTTYVTLYMLVPVSLAFLVVVVDIFWHRKKLSELGGLFFGVLSGIVLAYIVNKIFGMFSLIWADLEFNPIFLLVGSLVDVAIVFMCVTIVMQTKDDFRFVIPYVEFQKQAKGARPLLLDTSVIIDGRISDISDTRILDADLVIPRFVLSELQTIADSDDKLKRNRGRRGLDILNKLRSSDKIDIQILDPHVPSVEEVPDVDAKLVALAKHLGGRVVTNDYNLNKVAQLRGVEVININDLANALKPVVLPGETMEVKIIKPGEEPGQGVGYLEDGTMVVAEQSRDFIGKDVTIMVTSVLQTSAGRMIFGKLDADLTFGHKENSGS